MKQITMIITALSLCVGLSAGTKPYSVRMMELEISRCPQATFLDGRAGALKWNYTTGLELKSFLSVAERYDLESPVAYVRAWADTMVTADGGIATYKMSNYNVDHICPARIYFDLYDKAKAAGDKVAEKRYRKVLDMIRKQIDGQPRTSGGSFWHKKIYPHQVWLDGLYMAMPFYAEYTKRFTPKAQRDSIYADIASQFVDAAKVTYDPATGLFRHAWDESRSMFWADPQTGQSAHAWGRANGWFAVALVEVLDFIPDNHPSRKDLIGLVGYLAETLPRYADPETGMWYQVLDCPGREGNYLESTASAMFLYTWFKALRMGYIDKTAPAPNVKPAEGCANMKEYADRLYEDFVDTFIRENEDGTVSLTDCCSVAGLGGKTNRKGDYAYYLSEPVIENDCKGVGPFIWASLEYEAAHNIEYFPEDAFTGRETAFEGAEGGGKYTVGGRGGREYIVTTLEDGDGEGTLRHAVEAKGPRTVKFAVSGDIRLEKPLKIKNPYITISGETAPGEGITIRDYGVYVSTDEVIIRYLRFRLGAEKKYEDDALGAKHCRNLVVDHCSISWSTDENASFYALRDASIQWCIISEALNSSVHHKGSHGYGGIWGGRNVSFHHNLFAHNNSRNPRFDHPAVYDGDMLYRRGTVNFYNNVVYNWGMKAIYGGEEGWFNVVGNCFKAGPASKNLDGRYLEISTSETTSMFPGSFYIKDNIYDVTAVRKGNFYGSRPSEEEIAEWKEEYREISADEPFVSSTGFAAEPARKAFKSVLKGAGASLHRDCVDRRIIKEVRSGKTTFRGSVNGLPGIIDNESDVEL